MAKSVRCATLLIVAAFFSLVLSASSQVSTYDEPYRPQVHFSPRENWTNDPNGLVYFQGEYHLFFQHNPFGNQWGHMSWGHAVSSDLLHWQQLPVGIPESDGTMIATGSIVIDHNNASGLCNAGSECLVAIYTGQTETPQGHRETQNLASSVDKGRTWTKYKGNPVIDLQMRDFRDPSVSWDAATRHWVMAVSLPKEHKVRFYSSANLKQWTQLSDFGPAGNTKGDWECPDLLRIPAAKGKEMIWALKIGLNTGSPQGGSGEQYFLGRFDGTTFTSSSEPGASGWTNDGKDDYCAINFNELPAGERPVLLGWMSNWQYASKMPTSPWRGQMSLPRRLSFIKDGAGLALQQDPVIAPLRGRSAVITMASLSGPVAAAPLDAPYEMDLQFGRPAEKVFGVKIYSDEQHWTEVGFDTTRNEFYIDRSRAGIQISPDFSARTTATLVPERPYNLRLVVDRSSVEAYAQDDTIAMTNLIYPSSSKNTVRIFPSNAKALKVEGRTWELKSIWKPT